MKRWSMDSVDDEMLRHFPPRSAGASLKRGAVDLAVRVEQTFPRVLRGPH